MGRYTYRICREAWVDVDIEASDEDEADMAFNRMQASGELSELFRDEVLESDTFVAEIWDGGPDEGICIYSGY